MQAPERRQRRALTGSPRTHGPRLWRWSRSWRITRPAMSWQAAQLVPSGDCRLRNAVKAAKSRWCEAFSEDVGRRHVHHRCRFAWASGPLRRASPRPRMAWRRNRDGPAARL